MLIILIIRRKKILTLDVLVIVLKLGPFKKPKRSEVQGFSSRTEIQQRPNCDVSFKFLIYLVLKFIFIINNVSFLANKFRLA